MMNLLEELHSLRQAKGSGPDSMSRATLFLELHAILCEMAKRIEALEQREHSHPLGVGSYTQRRLDV